MSNVESQSRQSIRKQLEAGYLANKERGLAIAAEWFPLEEEAAAKASKNPNRIPKTKRK